MLSEESVPTRHTIMYPSNQRSGDKYLAKIYRPFSSGMVDDEVSLAKDNFKDPFVVDIAEISYMVQQNRKYGLHVYNCLYTINLLFV